MLYLNDAIILGKGTTRTCYLHPENSSLCIKIMHSHFPVKINELEYKAYNDFQKREISLKHLPLCYGFVETDLGKGLVYERIISDYEGSLPDLVNSRKLNKEYFSSLLKELENYCLINSICMCDRGMRNLILSKGQLYYIDGIVTNKKNKSFLYSKIKFYSRRKTRKTISSLLDEVEQAYTVHF